jgi:hypothetical protein
MTLTTLSGKRNWKAGGSKGRSGVRLLNHLAENIEGFTGGDGGTVYDLMSGS